MNILFIGNSYTYYNDLDKLFEALCRENNKNVTAFRVTKGGRKLIQYTDAEDPVTQELTDMLAKRQYQVCFLQEQSLMPATDYDGFWAGLTHVLQMLQPQDPQIILYATWGRKAGSTTLEDYRWTTETMTELIDAAYQKAGDALNAKVSAVGRSFWKVTQLDPRIDLHDPDLTHPSYLGSCLAALTHYYTLFGVFPENTSTFSLSEHALSVFKTAVCQ